jgi:hypothetical protein
VTGPDRRHEEHKVVPIGARSCDLDRRQASAPAVERGPQNAKGAGLITRRTHLGRVGIELACCTLGNTSGVTPQTNNRRRDRAWPLSLIGACGIFSPAPPPPRWGRSRVLRLQGPSGLIGVKVSPGP